MKTKILFILTLLFSTIIYSQSRKIATFHTLDLKNAKINENFINLNYQFGGFERFPKLGEYFVGHGKIGIGYSVIESGIAKSSQFYIPIQYGGGLMYQKDFFKLYTTVTAGLQTSFLSSEISGNSSSDTSIDFISSVNIGGMFFFGNSSRYGIITEFSPAIKGIDNITVGLVIRPSFN